MARSSIHGVYIYFFKYLYILIRSQLNGERFRTTKVKYIIVLPDRMVGVQFRTSHITRNMVHMGHNCRSVIEESYRGEESKKSYMKYQHNLQPPRNFLFK